MRRLVQLFSFLAKKIYHGGHQRGLKLDVHYIRISIVKKFWIRLCNFLILFLFIFFCFSLIFVECGPACVDLG